MPTSYPTCPGVLKSYASPLHDSPVVSVVSRNLLCAPSQNVPKCLEIGFRDISGHFGNFGTIDAMIFLWSSETIESHPINKTVEPDYTRKPLFSKNLKCPEMSRNLISRHFETFQCFGTWVISDFETAPIRLQKCREAMRSFSKHLGSTDNS